MDIIPVEARGGLGNFVRAASVIPINDLKGAKSGRFAEGEQLLRCKLAACYRLIDLIGWTHGIYNHISVRVDSEEDHFLINPFGLLYNEITASSLQKIDLQGNIVDQGSTEFGVNKAGFTLHSAVHAARKDIHCVIHVHTPAAVAVSAMKCGLLPLSQASLICGTVGYHDYQGIFIDEKEKELLVKNLGANKILILRNHGIAVCGETIEEAFYLLYNLMAACEVQIRSVSLGLDNIVLPDKIVNGQINGVEKRGRGAAETSSPEWETGEVEFEAMMRALDNLGYRTGYNYKVLPMVKSDNMR